MIEFQSCTFAELTTHELYEILALRQDIFFIEQDCKEPDLDFLDQKAIHLMGRENNQLITYARIFAPDIFYDGASSIGRVATDKSARGKGIGRQLMQKAMELISKHFPGQPIQISAQVYLEKFYQSFGFTTISAPYDEAGIIHVKMICPA